MDVAKAKAKAKNCRYWMYTSLAVLLIIIATPLAGSFLLVYGVLHPPNLSRFSAQPGPVRPAETSQFTDKEVQTRVYKNITLTTTDGLNLKGWYVPSQNGATVILCHGFARDRTELLPESRWLIEQGFGTLLPDLRAQGESDGAHISFGYLEALDVQAAVDYIRKQSPQERIGVIGYSMGSVAAIRAAARDERIQAIIAVSPFASLRELVHHRLNRVSFLAPFVAWWAERLTGLRLDDLDPLKDVAGLSPRPILIMQAGADGILPQDSGDLLYEAAGEPRILWSVPAVEHVRFRETLPELYKARMLNFFTTYLLKK